MLQQEQWECSYFDIYYPMNLALFPKSEPIAASCFSQGLKPTTSTFWHSRGPVQASSGYWTYWTIPELRLCYLVILFFRKLTPFNHSYDHNHDLVSSGNFNYRFYKKQIHVSKHIYLLWYKISNEFHLHCSYFPVSLTLHSQMFFRLVCSHSKTVHIVALVNKITHHLRLLP